jgi:hypothetical protein
MPDNDPLGALVFGEAVRALDQQAASVEGIRSRAGVLLSAASIATSFLAGLGLSEGEGLGVWSGLASLAFGVVGGLCVAILWPRRQWFFTANPKLLVRDYLDPADVDLARTYRNLALWADTWAEGNRTKIRTMLNWFELACVLLAVEIAFWIAELAWGR